MIYKISPFDLADLKDTIRRDPNLRQIDKDRVTYSAYDVYTRENQAEPQRLYVAWVTRKPLVEEVVEHYLSGGI